MQLALGGDDLGPLLALGLGLLAHGALDLLGQVHALQLHAAHLHAPGLRGAVDDLPQASAELLPVRQQLVQAHFAQDGAQGGLGDLAGGVVVVLHAQDGLLGVQHPE